MRTLLITLAIVLVAWPAHSNAQGFNKRYDAFGSGYEQGAWGVEATSFGCMVFGFSYEPDTIDMDSVIGTHRIILTALDQDGFALSETRHSDHGRSMYLGWADCCDAADDGFVSAGTAGGADAIGRVRLMRYGPTGDTLWVREFGTSGFSWVGQQVKHLADGGFVVCGGTNFTGDQDGFLIRTDAEGNELWRQTYGWTNPVYIDGLTAVCEATDGDFYMSGSRFTSMEEDQHWVQRTDPNGDLIWRRNWGGPYKEGATYLTLASDGRVIVAGGSGLGPEYSLMRPYLAKLDSTDGSTVWEQEYGQAIYSTIFFAAKECPNTDIIACGVTYEGGYEQGLLLRATSDGDSLWMRRYAYYDEVIDSCRGRFWDVLPTADGGFIASGFANGPFNSGYPPGYSQDAWVVKLDADGCIVPGCDATGVSEIVTNLRDALTLFPNPAHGQVSIQLQLPASYASKDLRLSLVSSDGRVVRHVPWRASGAQLLDVHDLSPGLYTVHVTDGGTWVTGGKLIIE